MANPKLKFKVHGEGVTLKEFTDWTKAVTYAMEQTYALVKPVHIDVLCNKEGWEVMAKKGVLPDLHVTEEFYARGEKKPYNARYTIEMSFLVGQLP